MTQLELFPREPEPVGDNVIDLTTGRPLLRDPEPLIDPEPSGASDIEEIAGELVRLGRQHGAKAAAGFVLTEDGAVIQFVTKGVRRDVYMSLGAAQALAIHIERYLE